MSTSSRFKLVTADQVGEAIIDIPHPGLLEGIGPVRLVEDFESKWGVAPHGISLPVALPDGTMYEVDGLPGTKSASGSVIRDHLGREYEFSDLVSAFSAQGMSVFLTLDPTCQFLNMPALQIVDSQQDTSRPLCITKPRTRLIVGAILGTGMDIASEAVKEAGGSEIAGMGIDVCNLWPMGATDGLIEATCFCPECIEAGGEAFERILRDSQAFNLGLKDAGKGISFIEDIRSDMTQQELLDLSRSRGFTAPLTAESSSWISRADTLLSYLRKRHVLTVGSVEAILNIAAGEKYREVSRFLICENAEYAWTSGLFLRDLDGPSSSPAGVEELWLDSSGTGIGSPRHLMYRTYLWRRSRYIIDEFLRFAATLSDPGMRAITGAGRLTDEVAAELLRGRLQRALGSGTSLPSQLAAMDAASQEPGGRRGFVAVALNSEMSEGFIRRLEIAPALAQG